jgi:lipoprotein-releasing system permease protein
MRSTPFMKEGQSKLPNIRRFKIVGIFNLDFKNRCDIRIRDIRHMQRINKWKADQVAFEVFVDDFDNIKTVGEDVYQHTGSMLDTKTIIENSYIFEWLQLFDFNIIVIDSDIRPQLTWWSLYWCLS